jgi:hypothetical protein
MLLELILWVKLANGLELMKPATEASCFGMARMQAEYAEKGEPIPAAAEDGRQSYVVEWECKKVERETPTS